MTRLASSIREADKPIFCSACFNQQDVRHIDFDAACDRGYGNTETVQVALDDLIVCENCVREAAELLGLADTRLLTVRVSELEDRLEGKERMLAKAEAYATRMEEFLEMRGQRVDHRSKPRRVHA